MNIIFLCTDLDGPILDCQERYYAVYQDLVNEFGGQPISRTEYWDGKKNRVSEKNLLSLSSVKEICYDEYSRLRISRIEDERYLEKDLLQPHSHTTLVKLSSVFPKIILITMRRNEAALMKQLTDLDILRFFHEILTGYNENIPGWKVKAGLFVDRILRRNNISGYKGFFVGDTEVDILAGKELGLQTVAVLSGIRSAEILKNYRPDLIVDDLSDFYHYIHGRDSNGNPLC